MENTILNETNQAVNNDSLINTVPKTATVNPNKKNRTLFIIVPLIILLLLCGGIFASSIDKIIRNENNIFPIPLPTQPTIRPIPINSIPSDWKTYTNEEYGYEFKYPAELFIEKTSDTVTVYTEKKISVRTVKPDVVVIPNFNLSLKRKPGALDKIIKGYPEEGEVKWGSNTYKWSFDGAEATGYYYYYIQDKSGVWYEFSTYSPGFDNDVDLKDANDPQFWDTKKIVDTRYRILSTFKFLDQPTQTPTTNWKTYTNEEYRFKFNYPPDWESNIVSDMGINLQNKSNTHKIKVTVYEVTGFGYCYQYSDETKILVDGKPAVTAVGVGGAGMCEDYEKLGNIYILIPLEEKPSNRPAKQVHISYDYPLTDSNQAKSNLNQILPTFKFMDNT